jgi:site-specific DNA-methyltransferase (adenine-specific)
MSHAVQHLQSIKIKDEYGTPKELFREACYKFKICPEIDVAASKQNHVLQKYYTIADNSLLHDWHYNFFMNPPYSQVSEFMKQAYYQHLKHAIDGLCLVYSKTETNWWHNYVEGKAEVHFIKGRIKFLDAFGNPTKNSSPYPSAWVIYRA